MIKANWTEDHPPKAENELVKHTSPVKKANSGPDISAIRKTLQTQLATFFDSSPACDSVRSKISDVQGALQNQVDAYGELQLKKASSKIGRGDLGRAAQLRSDMASTLSLASSDEAASRVLEALDNTIAQTLLPLTKKKEMPKPPADMSRN